MNKLRRITAVLLALLLLLSALPAGLADEVIDIEPAPFIEEPVVEEPVIEEPVVEEPIVEEPVVEEPVVEEPVVEEPVVEEPVVEEPVVEEPIVEEPIVEEPVVEEPVVEEPIVEEPIVEEPAAPFAIEPAAVELAVNETIALAVNADAAVVWTSSDETVANVDETGLVTAIAEGTAVITATAEDGSFAECEVSVLPVPAVLSVTGKARMQVGKEYALTAAYDNGEIAEDIIWTSSDEAIASIDENGVVVGAAEGEVVFTATDANGAYAEFAAEIIPATIYINTDSNKAFSKAVSKNNNETAENIISKKKAAKAMSSNKLALMRIIVTFEKGYDFDVDQFNPVKVIVNSDRRAIMQFSLAEEAKAALEYLNGLDCVKYAEPDCIASIDTVEDEMEASAISFNSWGANRMDANALYSNGTYPNGSITVAIIDTGISAHSFIGSKRIAKYDYVDADSNPTDQNGHGTHVAGTVVDLTQPLNVKVAAYRVLDENGEGYVSDIIDAMYNAADDGCRVINMSLGGDYNSTVSSAYKSAISYCIGKNTTVCIAAGNENRDVSKCCPSNIDMNGCIIVASIDNYDTKSYFSNYGSSVDVAAPGESIYSCNYTGGYTYMSGTSMATPHIAAVCAATILYKGITNPASVESTVKSLCDDINTNGWDKYTGNGVPVMSRLQTVTPPPADEPSLDSSCTLTLGFTKKLKVENTTSSVTWKSKNTSIVTVNSKGKLTAKKAGTATIVAKVDGKKLKCTVTVVPNSHTYPNYNDDYDAYYINLKKAYYSGSTFYAVVKIYNNTYYEKVTKIKSLKFKVYDPYEDIVVANKKFGSFSTTIYPDSAKKLTLKYSGSATKNKINLPEKYDNLAWDWTMNYYYKFYY